MMRIFICPECKGKLIKQENVYYCPVCSCDWQIKDGIPVFLKTPPPYWCELPQGQAEELNSFAKEHNWRWAIEKFFPEHLRKFVLDDTRINWKYSVNSDTRGNILDIGCGWGTLSFAFAKDGAQVYAFEPVWERISFINTRAKQENMKNLISICGDVLKLPFEDSSFDIVILNGVVEWLGLSDKSVSADKVQEMVLKDVYRILKPGGSVYIGIENRLAYFYFFGKKDPHSGLRFVNLMPRGLADIYSQLVKKHKYHTYIHSLGGYRKLLGKAGFKKVDFFTPVPGYLNFKYILPLSESKEMNYWVRNIICEKFLFAGFWMRMAYSVICFFLKTPFAWGIKYFVPDYSMLAKKEDR